MSLDVDFFSDILIGSFEISGWELGLKFNWSLNLLAINFSLSSRSENEVINWASIVLVRFSSNKLEAISQESDSVGSL